jgi:hypothetical protein
LKEIELCISNALLDRPTKFNFQQDIVETIINPNEPPNISISVDDLLSCLIFVLIKSNFKDIQFLLYLVKHFTLKAQESMTVVNFECA